MADTKISALPASTTPLTGSEVLPVVQSGTTKQVSVANLTTGRAISASGVTVTGGTVNGVAYLNGSNVLTTGSALTFNGTNFVTTGSATGTAFIPSGSTVPSNGMYLPASNTVAWSTNTTERTRLDSSGNLLVGTTSNTYTDKAVINGSLGLYGPQLNVAPGSNFEFVQRSAFAMRFYVNSASVVADLSITGVWTNASDARYKENITDSPYGLATVMALKPRAYNLINLTDKPQIGFIAQEVIDVVPEVVESVHNNVTNEDRYTLSYGQLSAVFAKAIQEQQTLIQSLTARVTALEKA
jgi:hypothetical protein